MSTLVYGLHDLESLADEQVSQIGISETNERIMEWNADYNRTHDAIMGTFTQKNEEWNQMPITKYNTPAPAQMQSVDEHGVAKPMRETGSYQVGLPLHRHEANMAMSYEAMKKITVAELSRQLELIERADMNNSIRMFLHSLFYPSNWTFTSEEDNFPDIPVKALANNDTITYNIRGAEDPATANHYAAQAGDIGTTDPFPTIKETLSQYTSASPNSRIVSFVGGTTNVSQIKALDGFYRVDRTQFVEWGDNVSLVDPMADIYIGMGDEVIGEHEEGILVIRWRRIPDNYILSFNLDAPAPIGVREDTVPALRGLFNISGTENSGNTIINRFRRKQGMAPVNRTGAMITRVGNGTYAAPTGYTGIPN